MDGLERILRWSTAREKSRAAEASTQGTRAATTLRKGPSKSSPHVLDGPFAETKEQFLGFYLVECANIDEAVAIANELAEANRGPGGYEIRPVAAFFPGGKLS